MGNLEIEKTNQTPEINFNTNGVFLVKGISTPDNVQKFYQPVFNWLNDFKLTNPVEISLTLEIDYLNTSSTRVMVELLNLLNTFKQLNTKISILWLYEDGDDDMLELGEDLKISSKSEIEFKAI